MSTKQFVDEFNSLSIESPKLKELLELMNKKEDLHPDLVPYLVVENKIPYLKHPLLYVVMPSEAMYASYNKRYEVIKSMIAKSMEEEDFEGYVFHHERPYRLEAFMDIEGNLDDKRYWTLLGEIWTDSENTWQNIDEWNELLTSNRGYREYLMDENDRKAFEEFPEKLTIYRGHIGKNKKGFSYTIDREKAVWFSKRFRNKGDVLEITVNKSEVLAYFGGRNEKEILYIPVKK